MIKNTFGDLRQDDKVTTKRLSDPEWVGVSLLDTVIGTYLKSLNEHSQTYTIAFNKLLCVVGQAALLSRAGELSVSQLYGATGSMVYGDWVFTADEDGWMCAEVVIQWEKGMKM